MARQAPSSAPRRAAVVGGNRIPFARSGGPYARASNQDMLTATLDGLVARFGLAGQQVGEVVAGAVLKHSRDFNLTREAVLGSQLVAGHPRLRHPAGLRHRPRGRRAGRQQDRPRADRLRRSPAASTPRPTRRSPSTRTCARSCSRSTAPRPPSSGSRPSPASARPRSCPRSRATPSRAPGMSMGDHMAVTAQSGASPARRRTSSLPRATATSLPPTTAASRTTWSPPTSVSPATRTCARTPRSRPWPG